MAFVPCCCNSCKVSHPQLRLSFSPFLLLLPASQVIWTQYQHPKSYGLVTLYLPIYILHTHNTHNRYPTLLTRASSALAKRLTEMDALFKSRGLSLQSMARRQPDLLVQVCNGGCWERASVGGDGSRADNSWNCCAGTLVGWDVWTNRDVGGVVPPPQPHVMMCFVAARCVCPCRRLAACASRWTPSLLRWTCRQGVRVTS